VQQPAAPEPCVELSGRREVVVREVRNLGVDEVLDEVERWRRRRAPARLEAFEVHRSNVPPSVQLCNTG
jgi:hypothetical protein